MDRQNKSQKKLLDRRTMLTLGLAGASVLALGKGKDLLASGHTRRVIKEAESVIPGFPKIRLREISFPPGFNNIKTPATMRNSMICEITQGWLETKQDGKPFTRKKGDIFTCTTGQVLINKVKGNTAAVMRILDLLSA